MTVKIQCRIKLGQSESVEQHLFSYLIAFLVFFWRHGLIFSLVTVPGKLALSSIIFGGALTHYPADAVGEFFVAGAINGHLCHHDLALKRLAAGFVVDVFGQAFKFFDHERVFAGRVCYAH